MKKNVFGGVTVSAIMNKMLEFTNIHDEYELHYECMTNDDVLLYQHIHPINVHVLYIYSSFILERS